MQHYPLKSRSKFFEKVKVRNDFTNSLLGFGLRNNGFDLEDGKKPHQMSQMNGISNPNLYVAQNGK